MRDRELVQRVKDATDLVALVGQAVKLRKQGAAWVGLCPFHSERTPSFQVVQERGFYHCFGCGKHGDAFSWLQEREGLSFPEALEQLAKAAGVELPAMRERSRQEVDLEARLRAVLEMAQAFYERRLADCGKAKDYLQGRAIAPDFAREAGVGYAPEAWEALVEDLRRQGLAPDLVEQSGLAVRNDRGNLRDFLRDRLTIPIHDARGRIIAFGGRAFGDGPKYLNTRETPLFSKGSVLFGFHRAKGHLRDGALVVEGYFDVLQLHQQGVNQAVAPLGTALTEQHLEQIKRFTKRLILCFDGDAAGTRAMEKSLKLALPLGLDVRLLLLPGGEDPDTWCLKLGSEAFQEMVRSAPDWTSFVVDRALEGRDFRRIPDRMAALQELAEYLGFLPNTPERRELFASLAHQLQVPLPELDRAVKSRVGAREGGEAVAPPDPQPPALEVDELLRPFLVLCREEALRREVAALPAAWWEGLAGAPLLQVVLDAEGDEDHIPEEILALLRRLEAAWAARGDVRLAFDTACQRLEHAYVVRELQALARQLQSPAVLSQPELHRELEIRNNELLQRERRLGRRMRGGRIQS